MDVSIKKIVVSGLILASLLAWNETACSLNLPNIDSPETFLGPTGSLNFNGFLNEGPTAYSVSGEAGSKNFRLGGVLGWTLTEKQRLKLSAEYLNQKIDYAFTFGNSLEWVSQGAVGAAWQYDFSWQDYHPQFNLNTWLSYAPSKTLQPVSGTFSAEQSFLSARRIAGSDVIGFSPGITMTPWKGGNLTAALIYDSVRYNTRYATDRNAIGFGGSIAINQILTEHVTLGVLTAARQPFDNYAATLSYNNFPYLKGGTLTMFGEYTAGKKSLPDTYNAGLSATFFLDQVDNKLTSSMMNLDGKSNLSEIPASAQSTRSKLLTWTTTPAVYMPQVLAIAEELVTFDSSLSPTPAPCLLPTFNGPIPDNFNNDDTINLAPYFGGSGLQYNIVSITPGLTTGSIRFDSVGGTLDYTVTDFYTVVVSASNSCGTVNSNPFNIGGDE